MKVALCLYGQPRHINNPYTWLSHKYHIIDKYKTDIFIHTWISGAKKEFEYSDWVNIEKRNAVESENASNLILKKYNPKKYIFEPPRFFSLDENSKITIKEKEKEYLKIWNGDFNWSENNENNTLSQLYSLSKSVELIDAQYDWIILSRYDNYIYDFPNLYQLEKDNLYLDNKFIYNFSDVLIVGGQKQIETLNCFDKIPELCEKISYFTPEEFKRVAFQMKYKEKRIRIGVAIARTDSLEKMQY